MRKYNDQIHRRNGLQPTNDEYAKYNCKGILKRNPERNHGLLHCCGPKNGDYKYCFGKCKVMEDLRKTPTGNVNCLSLLEQNICTRYPDIIVKIGDSGFPCCTDILKLHSTFFQNLKPTCEIVFCEECVTKNAFIFIYEWMKLNGDTQFCVDDNFIDVLMASHCLQVTGLEELCWSLIKHFKNNGNANLKLCFTNKNGDVENVLSIAVPRIQKYFHDIINSREFVNFTKDEICSAFKQIQ